MISLRAKYIVISPSVILENASISIKNGIIAGTSRPRKATYDFGNSIITPGLINSHTHLEGPAIYGYSQTPLKPPQKFTQWAKKVIALRQKMNSSSYNKTITLGYDRLVKNGTTTVVDHSHISQTIRFHINTRLRRFIMEEIIGFDKTKAREVLEKTQKTFRYGRRFLARTNGLLRIGFAPHSPYSISPALYKMLHRFAVQQKVLISTHLSELKEELEFLKTGQGTIKTYLKEIGRYTSDWQPPRVSPIRYFRKLGILKKPAFFVHCNYLSDDDISLLAKSGCSVVFCPNSQHYFGHRNHPFRKLLKNGVNVSLGTDGLGSNKDLSILSEMNFIWRNFSGLRAEEIFKMGTINGAKTLLLENKIGMLKPGFWADIAVFPITNNYPIKRLNDVLIYLIEETPKSIFTMVNGSYIKRK
jgi:cytosine/adenosine deaminase-related metal-dependent hydrolase